MTNEDFFVISHHISFIHFQAFLNVNFCLALINVKGTFPKASIQINETSKKPPKSIGTINVTGNVKDFFFSGVLIKGVFILSFCSNIKSKSSNNTHLALHDVFVYKVGAFTYFFHT